MIIDTHSHLNNERLMQDASKLAQQLDLVVCPSYSIESCKACIEVCATTSNVFGALAIHPSDEKTFDTNVRQFLADNLTTPKMVAVGEYGLDYHYQPFDKTRQQFVMLEQMNLAKQLNLPSIFHIRDAFDDFFAIMKNNLGDFSSGVVHCFDGELKDARQALDLGLMISFTGLITHKKKDALREVVKYVPLDRMMLETDSPYLAPEPFRGKLCVPQFVEEVYKQVAVLKNLKFEEVEEQIEQNVKAFFTKIDWEKIWTQKNC